MTIEEFLKAKERGETSSEEQVSICIDKIEKENEDINAFVRVFEEAKEESKNPKAGPLSGVPFSIKDAILVKGKETTSASGILQGHVATYDATVIERLKNAGAILLGHANMDDAAMGASNETSFYGPVKNPLDRTRVPGGSSGGSAASVASGMAMASLGSDTGGSVRQPASFCGLVGLRPTYGAVSRSGLIALASSLDQIGPITKTVADAEIVFNVISGKDPKDSTSRTFERKNSEDLSKEHITIGIPTDLPWEGVHKDVKSNFAESKEKLESLGYKTKDILLPSIKYGVSAYYIILPAEASSNLARLDGVRFGNKVEGANFWEDYLKTRGSGFGDEVRRRILLGTYVLSAGYYDSYYGKALNVRSKIKEEFETAFADVDAILMPTAPGPAFKLGEKISDPLAMYLEDLFAIPSALAGLPSISVPSGFAKEGDADLPIGMQFVAPQFREDIIFRIGKDFEK